MGVHPTGFHRSQLECALLLLHLLAAYFQLTYLLTYGACTAGKPSFTPGTRTLGRYAGLFS